MSAVTEAGLHIEFRSSNQAMVDDPCGEASRILDAISRVISKTHYAVNGTIPDSNGNTIGNWYWDVEFKEDGE